MGLCLVCSRKCKEVREAGGGEVERSKRPKKFRGAKQNLVSCSGEFGSLREMGTLWRVMKLARYQIVQPHFYKKEKGLCFA